MQTFSLFTLNYPKFRPEMGTPVRTSNGFPRFVKYPLKFSAPLIYPTWPMVKDGRPKEQFITDYRDLLTTRGLDKIADELRSIATASGDERLVLMCYEDLVKPGLWCHRTIFADWWRDVTGEDVRELGPTGPPPPAVSDPTLFD